MLITHLMSYGIVIGAIFNQIPQIIKILQVKSVKGISFSSLFNETLMLIFNIAYNMNEGTNFLLYGENIILYFEYLIVMLLVSYYDQEQKKIFNIVLLIFLSCILLIGIIPQIVFRYSIYINIILLFMSKWPQIYTNYKRQSTGQLAFLTHLQNQAGAIPRAISIFFESDNILLKFLMLFDNILILILTLQFIKYRNKKNI